MDDTARLHEMQTPCNPATTTRQSTTSGAPPLRPPAPSPPVQVLKNEPIPGSVDNQWQVARLVVLRAP